MKTRKVTGMPLTTKIYLSLILTVSSFIAAFILLFLSPSVKEGEINYISGNPVLFSLAVISAATGISASGMTYWLVKGRFIGFIRKLESRLRDWDRKDLIEDLQVPDETLGFFVDKIGKIGTEAAYLLKLTEGVVKQTDQLFRKQLVIAEKVAEGAQKQLLETGKASSALAETDDMIRGLEKDMQELSSGAEGAASAILEMSSSIEHVEEMAENVDCSVVDTSSSLEQMGVSLGMVSEGMVELTESTKETFSAIEDIGTSISEVEKNASDSARIAQETALSAEEGSISVEESTKGMEQIDLAVKDSARVIKSLGERSDRIGEVLDIINDIADQTNLLALNASIIAAQAGDQGKSFAVVAQEIRELAEKTSSSTREIDELITAVQSEADEAVRSMEVGIEAVEKGVKLSGDSAKVLEKIFDCAKKTEDMIGKITNATARQTRSSKRVTGAMDRMSDRVAEINSAMSEHEKSRDLIAKSTVKMNEMSTQLKRATQEQSRGSKSINEAIVTVADKIQNVYELAKRQTEKSREILEVTEKIDGIARMNTRSVEELKVIAKGLSDQVGELKGGLKKYRR